MTSALLQREQKPDVSPALKTFAYIVVLLIGLGLLRSLAKDLRRLDHISEQRRMAGGTEAHETKVASRLAREEDESDGDSDGDGSGKAKTASSRGRSG